MRSTQNRIRNYFTHNLYFLLDRLCRLFSSLLSFAGDFVEEEDLETLDDGVDDVTAEPDDRDVVTA